MNTCITRKYMLISYLDRQAEKICNNHVFAIRKIGPRDADKLTLRLQEIKASQHFGILKSLRHTGCHPLTGDRKGQYAVYLIQPRRLVFLPKYVFDDIGQVVDTLTVEITVITVAENYH